MNHILFPYATQDWSLGTGRALQLEAAQIRAIESLEGELWVTVSGSSQDFFVKAGDSLVIPCSHGQVVVEPVGGAGVARVALVAQSPLSARSQPSFWDALSVSALHPVAVALRSIADRLDPKFARA
jgi:Protein of unknown function (DUF2917)